MVKSYLLALKWCPICEDLTVALDSVCGVVNAWPHILQVMNNIISFETKPCTWVGTGNTDEGGLQAEQDF